MITRIEQNEARETAKRVLEEVKSTPKKAVLLPKGMMSDFKPKNKNL